MSCPSHEALVGFAAGDLDAPERDAVATHLSTDCTSCPDFMRAIADARGAARAGVLSDPPAWVLEKAARIPAERSGAGALATIGRLAALVFDTVRQPLPLGARSATAGSRQLLYRAFEYDIDVRIAAADSGRVRVSGQVLPGPDRPLERVAGVEVSLIRGGRALATCATTDLGEFDFGAVAGGDYAMSIEAEDERLVVDAFPARLES